jgi:hypothetical protein
MKKQAMWTCFFFDILKLFFLFSLDLMRACILHGEVSLIRLKAHNSIIR